MNTRRTTCFLMANLGSELIRFFNLRKRGDCAHAEASAARAFHIISQLLERDDIGNGKQEVMILKKIVDDSLAAPQLHTVSDSDLNSYFMPFAARTLAT